MHMRLLIFMRQIFVRVKNQCCVGLLRIVRARFWRINIVQFNQRIT